MSYSFSEASAEVRKLSRERILNSIDLELVETFYVLALFVKAVDHKLIPYNEETSQMKSFLDDNFGAPNSIQSIAPSFLDFAHSPMVSIVLVSFILGDSTVEEACASLPKAYTIDAAFRNGREIFGCKPRDNSNASASQVWFWDQFKVFDPAQPTADWPDMDQGVPYWKYLRNSVESDTSNIYLYQLNSIRNRIEGEFKIFFKKLCRAVNGKVI